MHHTLMLVQNNPYPQDTRVRAEAEALLGAGYAVSVISPAAPGQRWREEVNGAWVYRFPAPPEARGFWGYVWEYFYCTLFMFVLSLLALTRKPFDVIHAANPSDTLVFIAAFYKLFGTRFIFDHHDLSPELYDANCGGQGNRLVYHVLLWLEWLSCRLADHVIATNRSYRKIEMERGGVPERSITVVRNGPDLTRLDVAGLDPAPRPDGRSVIAYVGAMGPHDGLDCLLRALQHLVYDLGRTDFVCILIGRGEAVERLKALQLELGLADYVRFTGWVPEAEKLRLLRGADLCVDPDPWNPFNDRSTMIKVAEYMALGKPLVGFNLRENRFTAQQGGWFVTPNDEREFARALAQLLEDRARREALGAFGRRRVETELAWSYSVPHLLAAYRTVLGEADKDRIPQGQRTAAQKSEALSERSQVH
jgi:glycosyltransferase involved in cell wall biosynthesis